MLRPLHVTAQLTRPSYSIIFRLLFPFPNPSFIQKGNKNEIRNGNEKICVRAHSATFLNLGNEGLIKVP